VEDKEDKGTKENTGHQGRKGGDKRVRSKNITLLQSFTN